MKTLLAPRNQGCHDGGNRMQKPNYQFEKRRKELDKKAKKEAKRQQKLEASRAAPAGNAEAPVAPTEPT